MFKKLFPQSLVSRFMLIIILPTILFQCVIIYVFYQRHWSNVVQRTSYLIANNISVIIDVAEQDKMDLARQIANRYNIVFETTYTNYQGIKNKIKKQEFEILRGELKKRFPVVRIVQKAHTSEIFIQQGFLFYHFSILNKPLVSFTTDLFKWWWFLSNCFVVIISILFARNQIRSILALAKAADLFGKGLNFKEDFKPQGAKEIRDAGFAFIKMKKRIEDQMNKHTKMLAMISHDLKTPLTRLKLQIELLSEGDEMEMIKNDLDSMNAMIENYLSFAKGTLIDQLHDVNLVFFVKEYLKHIAATKLEVDFGKIDEDLKVRLNTQSFCRVLDNILSNSAKYAKCALISIYRKKEMIFLDIEDNGPGVQATERELILQPFYRADQARNLNTQSNVGLGLAIAYEIIKEHNGIIEILKSKHLKGLLVRITLPCVEILGIKK